MKLLLALYFCLIGGAVSEPTAASQRLLDACLLDPSEDMDRFQELLKDSEADVNVQDPRSGQTCLMGSVLRGKANYVRKLLEHGADATIPEKDGYTPVHGASFHGHIDVHKVLVEFNVAEQTYHRDGYLPFHRSCFGKKKQHIEFIKFMVNSKQVDPWVPTKDGRTCRDMTVWAEAQKFLDQFPKPDSGEL